MRYWQIILLLFFPVILSGQSLPCREHPYDDEFQKLIINSITRDKTNLLWLGTSSGVMTFDGYKYRRINIIDSLSRIHCRKIVFTSENKIWIAASIGLIHYDQKNTKAQMYDEKSNPALSNQGVYDIVVQKNGIVWVATWDGLNRIEKDSIHFFKPVPAPKYRENALCALFETDSGLWVGAESGSYFFSFQTQTFRNVPVCGAHNAYLRNYLCDSQGNIWAAVYNYGICVYDKTSGGFVLAATYFSNPSIPTVLPISLAQDSSFIWVGMEGGALRIRKSTSMKNATVDRVQSDMAVISLLCSNGNTWMGTWAKSLWQFNPAFLKMREVFSIREKFQISAEEQLIKIRETGNEMHFAFSGGIVIITDSNLNVIRKNLVALHKRHFPITFYKYIKPYSFYYAKSKLLIYNENTGREYWLTYKPDETGDLTHPEISDITIDSLNNIWIGSRKGLAKYSTLDFSVKKYYNSSNKHSLSHNQIEEFFITDKNTITVLTVNGISIYRSDSDDFIRINNPDIVRCNSIIHKEGYWVTSANGLLHLDENLNLISVLNESQGLLNNQLSSETWDYKGHIWVLSEKFISEYDLQANKFVNYPFSELLQEVVISDKNLNGQGRQLLWLTDKQKIYSFDTRPDNLSSISSNPVFTYLQINAEDKTLEQIIALQDNKTPMNLDYRHNNITVEISLPNYLYQNSNTYRYRLEGYDTTWINNGKERRIVYTNLSSGTYRLVVEAKNYEGITTSSRAYLNFIISPPFWQTWWFRFLMLLITVGIIWLFIRYRLAAMKKYQLILEAQVKDRTHTIERQKNEIKEKADVLLHVNQELNEQKEEIQAINEELRSQSEELHYKNEELNKLNATKDKFFTIIAHDLKNPFSAILGLSELLYNELKPLREEQHTEIAKNILESSKHTFNLLQNLLEWAKSQTGGITYKPSPYNIRGIVYETCNLLTPLAVKKKLTLENNIPAALTAIGDKNMITTVIRNLMNNAFKFTPEGGKISVSGNIQENNSIIISINDNGVGMDKETRNKLFRIDMHHTTSGTSGESGTGLGLIVCKEFVEKNQGKIWVESEPGKGSSFLFSIQKADNEILFNEPESHEQIIKPSLPDHDNYSPATLKPAPDNAPLVLIVDDNSDLRRKIRTAISSDYKTVEASDGQNGFNAAIEIIPDLIVSDVVMPVMDGLEMCSKLKADDRTSHIPIIMLSANDRVDQKVEGLQTGADDYLTKPFENIELLARVNTQIENRRKLKAKFESRLQEPTPFSKENTVDNPFMVKIEQVIDKNLENPDYDIDQFSVDLGMSTSQLYRKISAITTLKPYELIKSIRLKKAAEMLADRSLNINEIAYRVGFKDHSHFTKAFKIQFGVSPSEYQKR